MSQQHLSTTTHTHTHAAAMFQTRQNLLLTYGWIDPNKEEFDFIPLLIQSAQLCWNKTLLLHALLKKSQYNINSDLIFQPLSFRRSRKIQIRNIPPHLQWEVSPAASRQHTSLISTQTHTRNATWVDCCLFMKIALLITILHLRANYELWIMAYSKSYERWKGEVL